MTPGRIRQHWHESCISRAMTFHKGEGPLRTVTQHLGDSFFTRRVFQRWCRGEISTDMAAELLRPRETARRVRTRENKRSPTRWPVMFDVTLEIDPKRVASDATVGIVGLRLVHLGGSFVRWKPDVDRRPAVAQFQFSTPHERDRFVTEALEIPGVSLVEELEPTSASAFEALRARYDVALQAYRAIVTRNGQRAVSGGRPSAEELAEEKHTLEALETARHEMLSALSTDTPT
jgi:hypothetical protein